MNKANRLLLLLVVLSFVCLPYSFSAEVAVKNNSKSTTATTSTKQASTTAQSDATKGGVEFLAYNMGSNNQQSNATEAQDCRGRSEDQDYSDCRNGTEDTNIDDATETHRLKTWFLGDQWVVSDMATQSPANPTVKQASSIKKTINQKT